jgi:putative spermidine/putrescine transport system substrate-binding protein
MLNITIEPQDTLFDITERYPETIAVFVEQGFSHMGDPARRAQQGRMISLLQASTMKKIDLTQLSDQLKTAVRESRAGEDLTLQTAEDQRIFPPDGDIRVAGLLPCPVRIPMLEAFAVKRDAVAAKTGLDVTYRLAAASIGMDAVEKEMASLKTQADLPSIFVSAGFEAFFDHRNMARFKDRGVFKDHSWPGVNEDFKGLDLKDPDGHFAMISVVPAIFLVDTSQLAEGEAVPRTWSDILAPAMEKRIALPVGDFDLFNGILLTLWKEHGDEGIRALSRNMMKSLHPSQAAGRFKARKGDVPTVTVVPYFFSRMARMNPSVEVVWPEDGAIISPIFMLEQNESPEGTRDIADFFLSRETGEILSHRGLFPSLHPDVENTLPENAAWKWLGWDFIRGNDLGEMIPKLLSVFNEAVEV